MVAETNQRCYVPRNILITGGAGFIASHIAVDLALKYPEYEVSGGPARFRNASAKQHLSASLVQNTYDVSFFDVRQERDPNGAAFAA